MGPLEGCRVLDLTSGIDGAYSTKLLADADAGADAGADVVVGEIAFGNPLRKRTAIGRSLPDGEDGALFQFLSGGKRSVVLGTSATGTLIELAESAGLIELADVVVEDTDTTAGLSLAARHPDLVVVSLSPFGLDGPWAGRPSSDLTLQALSSSIASRGERTSSPVSAGGEQIDWTAGAVAAIAALLALQRRAIGGGGDHVDVAKLEVAVTIFNGFRAVAGQIAPHPSPPFRGVEVPSVEPTKDGWVGLCTLSQDQFSAFAEMIGLPEWTTDPELSWTDKRMARSADLRPLVAEWTRARTSTQILEEATRRRIPAAPIGNGEATPHLPHLVERKVFEPQPGTDFVRPRVPYLMSVTSLPPARQSPGLGNTALDELVGSWSGRRPELPSIGLGSPDRPLAGIRVFDFTSFWAGPLASQVLAHFGADVIKVESPRRPDGTRMATSYGITGDLRWERAPLFQGVNFNKRGITLDLNTFEGLQLARDLLDRRDILVENYSARVAEQLGLLDQLRPDLIVVQMPAWGTTGPFRDAPGFAQNMEQASGLAWVTGHEDGPPIVPRGPCDPNGGLHAAFAALLGLIERARTGRGQVIEVPLIETALNVAAEQFVEFGAYGDLIGRNGNRSRRLAPHDVYACAGFEEWIAVAVTNDDQWARLCGSLGRDDWAADDRLATATGRLAQRDGLDKIPRTWCASRPAQEAANALWNAGVPCAPLIAPHEVVDLPGLAGRAFYEHVHHPVIGDLRVPRFPAKMSSGIGCGRPSPAPAMSQHNCDVFGELLGHPADELRTLEESGVIATRPLP